jgi:hypothetical protein
MHSPRSPVYEETLARRGLPFSIFQSVIACVPTEWSHLQSALYGETLARWTSAVYPLDFSERHCVGGLVCSFGFA